MPNGDGPHHDRVTEISCRFAARWAWRFSPAQLGARADGYEVAAPAAVDEGRKFTYPSTLGATSDYVFRGISQTDNDPAIQGGADFGYGILYAGVWASGLDFADAPPANAEVDWYGGISRPGTRRLARSTSTSASSTIAIQEPTIS